MVRIANNEGYVSCCQKFKNTLFFFLYWKNPPSAQENGKAYFYLSRKADFFFPVPHPFEVLPERLLLSFTHNSIKSSIQRKEAARDKLLKIKPTAGKCAFKVSERL